MTRIVCFASGKGGVGKTTSTINVGYALMEFGQDVIIVDGNITTPNMSIHLGIPHYAASLHDVLQGKIRIENTIYSHSSGLKVVPSGISLENLKKNINISLSDSIVDLVGKTDWILIDSPAGLGRESRLAIEAANEVIIITNPELPSVVDALKAEKVSKDIGTVPLGVVINKRKGIKEEMSIENVSTFLELPVLSVIDETNLVTKSIAAKQPLIYLYPHSAPATQFKKIAAALLGQEYDVIDKPTVIQRIRKLLRLT